MHIVVCTLLPGSCGILGVWAGAREGTTFFGSGRKVKEGSNFWGSERGSSGRGSKSLGSGRGQGGAAGSGAGGASSANSAGVLIVLLGSLWSTLQVLGSEILAWLPPKALASGGGPDFFCYDHRRQGRILLSKIFRKRKTSTHFAKSPPWYACTPGMSAWERETPHVSFALA